MASCVVALLSGCDNASNEPPASPSSFEPQADIPPACDNPAPLIGTRDKTLQGWPTDYTFELVQLPNGSVDPAVLEQIKQEYGTDLVPGAGNPHVIHWTATLSREAAARLRCEPTVVEVWHPPSMKIVL